MAVSLEEELLDKTSTANNFESKVFFEQGSNYLLLPCFNHIILLKNDLLDGKNTKNGQTLPNGLFLTK
jgi:hypothetical protein